MNNISKRSILIALVLALLLALGLNACATGQKHRAMAENMIQTAKTKADHEAIAFHYEQEAEAALKKADQMRKHLEGYEMRERDPIPRQKGVFVQHCNSLIRKYNEIAGENKELAKLHRDMSAGM